jgi:hypothetical protein
VISQHENSLTHEVEESQNDYPSMNSNTHIHNDMNDDHADDSYDHIHDETNVDTSDMSSMNREVRDLVVNASGLDLPETRHRTRSKPEYYAPPIDSIATNILYEEAAKLNPEQANAAFIKEIESIESKGVWVPKHMHDLNAHEQSLVIDNMKNFVDKWNPDGSFDKYKARVLVRGDHQLYTANTEAPVCRVQSIFTIINLALLHDMRLMKIDVKSAFLNTPMPDSVVHKWVLLDRTTTKYLVKMNPIKWEPYVNDKGRVLVEMKKLMYGYKEAAHYWHKCLFGVFRQNGYYISAKDQCVAYKRSNSDVVIIAVTVDDCFIAYTPSASHPYHECLDMFKTAFGEITVEQGDNISIIGMFVQLNRDERSAKIQQKHYVEDLCKRYNVQSAVSVPHTTSLFDNNPDSPLLDNQLEFMSINACCMFAANRTYPELLLASNYLSTRYYHATHADYLKSLRMIQYMCHNSDHCLYLRPKSTRVVSAADASYAEHDDAKSHTGGCIGMEGHNGNHAYFIFMCGKQSVVAKSSCEAELIAQSTIGEYVVWLTDLLTELGFQSQEPAILYQDNISAMRLASQGTGTFKRSKHINVRYFWLKELIDLGKIVFEYLNTKELVADILSKPVTGALFVMLLAKLLGYNARPA